MMGMPQMMPGMAPQQPDKFQQALAILRSDKMRTFRISIETDSTIGMNRDQEKKDRTEFLMAAAQFLQNAAGVGQNVPELIPLLSEMLMFGIRGFGVGRNIEQVFEQGLQQLEDKAKAAESAPPQPPPEVQAEMIKAKSASEAHQVKLKMAEDRGAQQKEAMMLKAHMEQMNQNMEALLKRFEIIAKSQIDARGQDKDLQGRLAEAQIQERSNQGDLAVKARGQDLEAEIAARQPVLVPGGP